MVLPSLTRMRSTKNLKNALPLSFFCLRWLLHILEPCTFVFTSETLKSLAIYFIVMVSITKHQQFHSVYVMSKYFIVEFISCVKKFIFQPLLAQMWLCFLLGLCILSFQVNQPYHLVFLCYRTSIYLYGRYMKIG